MLYFDMDDMDLVTLDIEGDAQQMALAWASAAHNIAGPYWPAAFGYVAALSPPKNMNAMEWMRDVGRRADYLVDSLALMEREAGLSVVAPRYPAWYEEDEGLYLVWDTSVSLVLAPGKSPGNLRIVLYGEHELRERFIREALENKEVSRQTCIQAWADTAHPFLRC